MTESEIIVSAALDDAASPGTTRVKSGERVRWPLAYCLQPRGNNQQPRFESQRPPPKQWWSHTLYRGPGNKEVQILYSRTKAQSEIIARQFLDESIVGFDMEWPWNDYTKADLQNKIGLIQVATEDKIALFHIGLHAGKTTDEIIAPSLRQLIESPTITKLGVSVLHADFSRLSKYFRLNPKGAFELSHLYRLVKFGAHRPDLVSTKLVSLAQQVEDQLGYPLWKGDVRTSNWSKPLSQEQIKYAAGDAYAGYMLYHCMNFKRLRMHPTPPLPIHAEKYLSYKLSGIVPIQLALSPVDAPMTTSAMFFKVGMTDSISAGSKPKPQQTQEVEPKVPEGDLCSTSQTLYDALVLRRATLAEKISKPAYQIASNSILKALARKRPLDTNSLLLIKGIGKIQQEKYGDSWLEVISLFVAVHNPNLQAKAPDNPSSNACNESPIQPAVQTPSIPRRAQARGQPSQQLHTGLSFTMAETKLDTESNNSNHSATPYGSQDSLPSLNFGSQSQQTSFQRKRKRAESPAPELQQFDPRGPSTATVGRVGSAPTHGTSPIQPTTEPLPLELRIFRNKLVALSKRVARKLVARPVNAPPIVTDHTLDLIIKNPPRTQDDLERIPGIDSFLLACEKSDMNLLRNILSFAPARS
ncbi:uncharacterized protein K460DRAFT_364003 [Cucurbitaria berberidis CBS 394.84]|uniref:HRDC domain-containing protein n=1 Tax=Cucurbitaria berberidis CBS 394.84 TaxID=1168544 RepID=A0A9P4GKH6_9PLEO|nr:uncharacterized protein K460DRAFT_364003 [Cucurbitaria berberidis CBS 394.84]KAF1847993.1 hypothetical protein K460DRAFT_364003 [Cucurbitaria berberidis CBS 394.84]